MRRYLPPAIAPWLYTSMAAAETSGEFNNDWNNNGIAVFSQRMSRFFKPIAVRRICDKQSGPLVHVAYSRQINDASAKMRRSPVSLNNAHRVWAGAIP